jgi:hypothetical protein
MRSRAGLSAIETEAASAIVGSAGYTLQGKRIAAQFINI